MWLYYDFMVIGLPKSLKPTALENIELGDIIHILNIGQLFSRDRTLEVKLLFPEFPYFLY